VDQAGRKNQRLVNININRENRKGQIIKKSQNDKIVRCNKIDFKVFQAKVKFFVRKI